MDVAARLPQLAAQPEATRRLIEDHPDRVLFGSDELPLNAEAYAAWDRFLGGLGLAEPALAAVYAGNAAHVLKLSERRAHVGQA